MGGTSLRNMIALNQQDRLSSKLPNHLNDGEKEEIFNILSPTVDELNRFIDSTIAYQVYGKKVNIKFIKNIHKYILNGLKPYLTFVLKVSSKSSRKRLLKR